MKPLLRIALLLPVLLGTASCEMYKLEEIRHTEPTGTPFQMALATHYKRFVAEEEKNYDWWHAVYFADKGLKAAYGHDVEPETFGRWDIQKTALPDLQAARVSLVELLTEDAKTVRPQLAADAVYYFDCWVEQQSEGWQVDDIARCRQGFEEALAELTPPPPPPPVEVVEKPEPKPVKKIKHKKGKAKPVAKPKPAPAPVNGSNHYNELTPMPVTAAPAQPEAKKAAKPKPKPKAKAVAKPKAAPPEEKPAPPPAPAKTEPVAEEPAPAAVMAVKEPETASYIVFFNPEQSELTAMGKSILEDAAKSVSTYGSYRIAIKNHPDTPAPLTADIGPSSTRAQAIKSYLVALGIKEPAVEIMTANAPKVALAPADITVEIFISE